jgi:hypothetical protein
MRCGSRDDDDIAYGEEVSARAPPLLHGGGFLHVGNGGGGRSGGSRGGRLLSWCGDNTSDGQEVGEVHVVDPE